jgi:hypothetical protein
MEKKKRGNILDPKDELIPKLKDVLDYFKKGARSFCHSFHTCWVESSHNACLAFGEKRVHYWSSFAGRTYASYCKHNLGWSWISELYELLGLPVSDSLASYVQIKQAKRDWHKARQQSREYKARQRSLAGTKTLQKEAREKKSKRKGHDYEKDSPFKKQKTKETKEELLFKCKDPDCPRSFATERGMKAHFRLTHVPKNTNNQTTNSDKI